jgi:hypothetical protein
MAQVACPKFLNVLMSPQIGDDRAEVAAVLPGDLPEPVGDARRRITPIADPLQFVAVGPRGLGRLLKPLGLAGCN